MSSASTEATIIQFLIQDVLYEKQLKTLGATDSLLAKGLVDSLALLRIVQFCEEQFGVTIRDEDVLPDHFETVRDIATLVERLQKG